MVEVSHEDGVSRLIEQSGLLAQLIFGLLALRNVADNYRIKLSPTSFGVRDGGFDGKLFAVVAQPEYSSERPH